MKRAYALLLGFLAIDAAAVVAYAIWEGQRGPRPVAAGTPDPKRGEYLLHAADCVACHTEEQTIKDKGPILGGGRALKTPFGTFYGPNITKHPVHGIGRWSDAEFVRALRDGRAPAGHNYYPAFPYTSFTGMSERDILDIKAYIFTLPAVDKPNRPHELAAPYRLRFALTFWKWLFFTRGPFVPDPAKPAEWNRGAYLVNHVAHCGECHTPRGALGQRESGRDLAGNPDFQGGVAPNITPDAETGIGKWTEAEIADALKSGMLPDGDFLGGAMGEVVALGTGRMSDEDLKAIVVYLKSVPPVRHKVERKK